MILTIMSGGGRKIMTTTVPTLTRRVPLIIR